MAPSARLAAPMPGKPLNHGGLISAVQLIIAFCFGMRLFLTKTIDLD
jgi:hypothetical protein